MTALPTNISFGKVRGRFGSPILSAGDADGLPDFQPLTGLEVIFTPKPDIILNLGATPVPVTFLTEKIVCTLDDDGYLVGPDGREGVFLIATDDTDLAPTGWTYNVSFGGNLATYKRLQAFDISVPADSVRWLTAIAPVPSSSGSSTLDEVQAAVLQMSIVVGQAQQQASLAASSATAAATSATTATTAAAAAGAVGETVKAAVADTYGADIRSFGSLVGDAITTRLGCSVSAGSTSLTCATAAFASGDVGKVIIVPGAGAAGANLVTTIAARSSATAITLATAATTASTKQVTYGTDNSSAFLAAFAAWVAGRRYGPATSTTGVGDTAFEIPAGTYIVTQARCLMPSTATVSGPVTGLRWRGAGKSSTTIVYAPTTTDTTLFYNNNLYGNLVFEDMTFYGTDPTADFMQSVSSGIAQQYDFRRVTWAGTWRYGIKLTGVDNNSEMSWHKCGIRGDWTAFLFSPPPAGVGGAGSDQFLNYDFYSCSVEYSTGNFIDMASGGNINIYGGSYIHLGNGVLPDGAGSAAQTFFALRGAVHDRSVCRLYVNGARVEHRHALSKLIYSEWAIGNITFESVNTESHAGQTYATTATTAEFAVLAGGLPNITFKDCALMGQHKYHYDVNSYSSARRIRYSDSTIANFAEVEFFITLFAVAGTGNAGSRPQIEFDNCKGNATNGYLYPFDCSYNWQLVAQAKPKKRVVSVKNAFGGLPGGALSLRLPRNSILTRVRIISPATGSSSLTTWQYVMTNGDGTVLFTYAPGTVYSLGFTYDSGETFIPLNTANKAVLTLTPTNVPTTPVPYTTDAFCIIEYLG